jgi:hypothetical protein
MLKIATVRVSEDFLNDLSRFIQKMKLDKSSYLRDILKKGFDEDRQERLLSRYLNGDISVREVCNMLEKSPWDFFDLLKKKNLNLNVELEDWLDSARISH